jgi:hypothetical protein
MDDAGGVSRDEERRRVLELLAQGKISAAEADELLAALHGYSAAGDVRSSAAQQPAARRTGRLPDGQGSVPGFPALAVVMARVLARTIGRLIRPRARRRHHGAPLRARAGREQPPRQVKPRATPRWKPTCERRASLLG